MYMYEIKWEITITENFRGQRRLNANWVYAADGSGASNTRLHVSLEKRTSVIYQDSCYIYIYNFLYT